MPKAEQLLSMFQQLNDRERAATFLAIAREAAFPQAVRELATEAMNEHSVEAIAQLEARLELARAALAEAAAEAGNANAQLSSMSCCNDASQALRDAKLASHHLCLLQSGARLALKQLGDKAPTPPTHTRLLQFVNRMANPERGEALILEDYRNIARNILSGGN